ncbi:conserved hypothetical protein [delta proteobacterium NaphS2]|nr:conserved hypothetical protein [delta proteobacterium NaphS2]
MRIGNTVYHFQYFPNGLFKLVRERWSYFRYIYNDLENRTLYMAHIDIEAPDLQTLQDSLDRFYLIQEAHMARLHDLSADVAILNDLCSGNFEMSINGAGLFAFDSPADAASLRLFSMINAACGRAYLERKKETLNAQFSKIPITATRIIPNDITSQVYPTGIETLSVKYSENRLKWMALDALDHAFPLRKGILICMDDFARPGDRRGLTKNERDKLSAYADTLEASVIRLLSSSRPDWGYPLLLANARFQAITWSLKRNRLYLLDPFPESSKSVNVEKLEGDPAVTRKLADRAWRKYWEIRRSTFAEDVLDERTYNRMEEGAGRFAELENGRLNGNVIRVAYGRLMPSRAGTVPLIDVGVSKRTLTLALTGARMNRKTYYDQLKDCYPYDLIKQNCATELIQNMNAPFQKHERVAEVLGGKITPGEDFGFIPFRLFDLVKSRYRVVKIDVLPGYRKRMLIEKTENAGSYLQECNTLTSTLYHGSKGDTQFIFFTDDVVWIRPLYGLINGAYGLITAALGVFTLPVDGGELSVSGIEGTLYSLPEIFFFNIRKGSFDYVDEHFDSETASLERSSPAFDRHVSP